MPSTYWTTKEKKPKISTQNSCSYNACWCRDATKIHAKRIFRPIHVRRLVRCSSPQAKARVYGPSGARNSDPAAPGQPSAGPTPPLRSGTFSRPSPAALKARCRSARPAGERKRPPAPPPPCPSSSSKRPPAAPRPNGHGPATAEGSGPGHDLPLPLLPSVADAAARLRRVVGASAGSARLLSPSWHSWKCGA